MYAYKSIRSCECNCVRQNGFQLITTLGRELALVWGNGMVAQKPTS